jgi:predicted nucleic acid-binding protein
MALDLVSGLRERARDLRAVLKTAMGLKVSFYEAEYLVTSIRVGAPLLSADDALFRVAGEAGRGQHLRSYKAA